MKVWIGKLLLAELLAFGAFVFGGLALLGGAVTWTGDSQLPLAQSWGMVGLFAVLATIMARAAAGRLKRVFQRPAQTAEA